MLAILFVVAGPSAARGKSASPDPDLHPLRAAATSSPRATLRGFLADSARVIEDLERGVANAATYRARARAIDALDLGATPDGDSWAVQGARMLLLADILDRLEIPPDEAIPGEADVAAEDLTSWMIPNTRIHIARVEAGPRKGEYLFSAGTVARLDRLQRQARELPSRSGRDPGIFEALRGVEDERIADPALRNRLKPVDTSSPRTTLQGFLDSVNRSHDIARRADAALRAEPPEITPEEARALDEAARNLLARAASSLDLSRVPSALRENVGLEVALQIKEILDRLTLPPIRTVPDARMHEAHRNSARGQPLRWRVPDTEIEIVEITEGKQSGRFLFSADTVARADEFYDAVRDLRYRDARLSEFVREYRSPRTSEGFYEWYITTPGYLVPRAHTLGVWVEGLPPALRDVRGELAVWQWGGLGGAVLGFVLATVAIFRFVAVLARRVRPPFDAWAPLIVPAGIALILGSLISFIDDDLNVSGDTLTVIVAVGGALFYALAGWGVFMVFRAGADTLVRSARFQKRRLDSTLAKVAARLTGSVLGAWVFIAGLRALGADLVPLLAGLGVGGLAVALAAQTTLANFFGSLILLANKPIREGDFFRFGDQIGTVEKIGLHSTRIRTLERTIVTVPNADLSQMQLDNFQARDQRLFRTTLPLRFETTPEQLRFVVARLRALLLGHPEVLPDPARVRFIGYSGSSKDLEIFAYLRCQEQNDFLAIREDLLFAIEDIVEEAGTAFALPGRTTYLASDAGVDEERRADSEAEVERWRREGRLPFPDYEPGERERLEDALEYPPPGSPDQGPSESTEGR